MPPSEREPSKRIILTLVSPLFRNEIKQIRLIVSGLICVLSASVPPRNMPVFKIYKPASPESLT